MPTNMYLLITLDWILYHQILEVWTNIFIPVGEDTLSVFRRSCFHFLQQLLNLGELVLVLLHYQLQRKTRFKVAHKRQRRYRLPETMDLIFQSLHHQLILICIQHDTLLLCQAILHYYYRPVNGIFFRKFFLT